MPTLDKELFLAEHSDLEEGGLDLTVSLKPVSFYISDKKEMLQQCFCIIGEKKLQKMLPDVLKVFYYISYEITHLYINIQILFVAMILLNAVYNWMFSTKTSYFKNIQKKGF